MSVGLGPSVVTIGAGGGAVAAGDITDAGAVGVALVQAATAASARSAVGLGTSSQDLSAWSAWQSLPERAASITAGVGTVSVDANYNTLGAGPYIHGPLTGADVGLCDIAVRLDLTSGDGEAKGAMTLWSGVDTSNAAILVLYGDGTWKVGRLVGGAWTQHAAGVGATSSGDRTGGQLWMRVGWRGAVCTYAIGVGVAGALPTSWTILHRLSQDAACLGSWAAVRVDTEATPPSVATTVLVLDVRAGLLL